MVRALGSHGHSRRFAGLPMTSGLPPEADILRPVGMSQQETHAPQHFISVASFRIESEGAMTAKERSRERTRLT